VKLLARHVPSWTRWYCRLCGSQGRLLEHAMPLDTTSTGKCYPQEFFLKNPCSLYVTCTMESESVIVTLSLFSTALAAECMADVLTNRFCCATSHVVTCDSQLLPKYCIGQNHTLLTASS
jgi:hypothetical protein